VTVLDDFRQKYPQYKDVPDGKLAAAIRQKYYADMPAPDFYRKAGLTHLVGLDDATPNGLGSDSENAQAGTGKSVIDNLRGLGQSAAALGKVVFAPEDVLTKLTGRPNVLGDAASRAYDQLKQDQTDANQLDAALMGTKAGLGGYVGGQAIQAVGAGAALKGAGAIDAVAPTTFRGAALAGGAQGAIQPLDNTQGEGQRLLNAGMGAAGGIVGQTIPSAVGAGARTIRSLIDPLTDSGQERILANTIAKFGQGGNMTPTASAVPGVQPTLAEATGNAGLGRLQLAVKDSGAGDGSLNAFVQRDLENNAARVASVRGVAGSADDLSNAIADRSNAASALYSKATSQPQLSEVPQAIQDLGKRPAMQEAVKVAKNLAANEGVDIGNPLQSVQGLHYVKLALDDMLTPSAGSAIGRNQ
jgi:hypothetical protein